MGNIDKSNQIHPTARIGENVKLGKYNIIGPNVIIEGFKGEGGEIVLGDCNVINDDTRILAGKGGVTIGDWNVFHNNMLVMGENKMKISHNCWFGQNTILDSSGELEIGNGVRVGMYSQIWTHVASGELIEGCTLFGQRKTFICDDVWLVGSCLVSSGVTIGKKCIVLSGSNVTKNLEESKVYAGNPAKLMDKLNFYNPVTLIQKFQMMENWSKEFIDKNSDLEMELTEDYIKIENLDNSEHIYIVKEDIGSFTKNSTVFNISSKKYNKRLTALERKFYKFIYNYKARFIPE